ncbi:MAG: secretin N-terminal domain-containing protein [Gemmataceae bacterium]
MRSKSILVGVLALGLGLLATRGVTGQDKDKKEPETKAKVGEPVKDKATEPGKDKVDEPTVPVKGKLLLFEMRGKPWEQVFEWLADQTGLHYVSEYKAPTGSFTFIAPRTADGKPRLYTVPDVIDIINEALLAKKHTLLRRKTSFTLWPADEKIPPYMIQQVSPEELRSDFGSTEVVQVVKRFKRLVADDIKGEVKRRMGPFGDIAALDAANELWMQDTAGNLRRILADLDRIENDEPLTETFTYRCKNIRASDAERILKDALGEGKTIIESTKGPAAVSTPSPEGKGERPEGKGFFFGKGGDRESSRPTTTTKVRVVHITSDDRTNTVIINAKADKIGQAKAILSEIDVPESPVNRPVLVHYPVSGNADATIKMLSDLYKPGASLRFWATSASTVSVFASPVEQEKISDIIRGPRATTKTEVVGLALLDSTRLAETLIKMFGDTKSGAPYIEADPLRNAIIIKGNPDQVKEVKDAIRAIGENPAAISGSMRIIGLDKGSAATLGTAIEQLFPQMRDNPFKLILPGSGDYIPKKAPAKEEPPVKELKPKLSPIFFEAGDKGPIVDPAKKRKKDLPPVTITAFGSKLIVTSDDKDALALVTELVRLLTTAPGEGDFQLIPLKNANATDAARILDEAFNGKPAPRGGGGRPGGPLGGGLGGLMMSAIGLGGGGGETPAERVRVVADPSINSLLVKANPLDMLTIRALVAKIDSGPSDDAGVGRTHVVGPLKSAAASEVATIIRDVYKQAIDGGPSEARVGGFPGFAFPIGGAAAGGGGAARKAPILAVGVDDKTNSLVVHAPDGLFKDIKTLIDELEKRAEDAQTVVQVVGVKGMDPYVVQQAMDALQGRNTFRRTTTGTGGFGPGGGFNPGGGGFNPGGGFGPGGFNPGGTGVFPGVGVFPRFGGTGFGGTGFGGPGMGGFGTGGPGGGGFRGPGGGGRGPGGRVSMADPPGGRDFFVSRVTDDPERTSILYDPRVERIAAAELNTFSYVSHEEEDVIEPVRSAVFQEAGDKDGKDKGVIFPGKDGLPGKLVAGKGDTIVFPRLPVTIEALPELNIVVIRAANPADLEAALKIIKLIQDKAAGADVEIRIVPLRQADPVSVSVRLNEFYQRVLITPTATSIVSGLRPTTSITLGAGGAAPGGATISSGAAATVATNLVFIPLVRQHALWIAAPKARMDDVMKQVQALDQPTALESKTMPFALKRQPANRVAAMISSFYADRFPTEARTQNIVRVTSDDATNTVFVQASPADMADIKSLIEHIDNTVSPAVSELRVVPLRNAVSDDLASIITPRISDTFFGTTSPAVPASAGLWAFPAAADHGDLPRRRRPARRVARPGHSRRPGHDPAMEGQLAASHRQGQAGQGDRERRAGGYPHHLRSAHEQPHRRGAGKRRWPCSCPDQGTGHRPQRAPRSTSSRSSRRRHPSRSQLAASSSSARAASARRPAAPPRRPRPTGHDARPRDRGGPRHASA